MCAIEGCVGNCAQDRYPQHTEQGVPPLDKVCTLDWTNRLVDSEYFVAYITGYLVLRDRTAAEQM